MGDSLISVIVPAYNAEKWIMECCQSVMDQTHTNWELIVVDDGSQDGTWRLLQKIAAHRENIKVIHTDNQGVCHARNVGLEAAKGEYISFLDADDRLTPDALRQMYALVLDSGAEIGIMSKIRLLPDGAGGKTRPVSDQTELWQGNACITKALQDHPAAHSVYAKLYRSALLENIRFEDGRKVHEDSFFVFQCLAKARLTAYQNTGVYLYRTTPGSASRQAFSEKYFDILYFADRKAEFIQKHFPELSEYVPAVLVRANLSMLYNLSRTYDQKYHARQQACLRFVREHQQAYTPVYSSEKRFLRIIRFRLFWLYKLYLHFRLKKQQ